MDFALGALLSGVALAYTVGSMGADLSVADNFLLSGKKQIFYAFVAGCVFNLANMLIVAGIELAGMSVAIPIGMGISFVLSAIWTYFTQNSGSPLYVFGAAFLVSMAVVLIAIAHAKAEGQRRKIAAELEAAATAELAAAEPTSPVKKKKPAAPAGPGILRGVWVALAGGFVMGAFLPLVNLSMEAELGLSNPYAVTMIAAAGMLISTFIYNLYFMNLPVRGLPTSFFAYFTGTLSQHLLGLAGGTIWMIGISSYLLVTIAPGEAKIGPWLSFGVGSGSLIVSALCGILIWKEFDGAEAGAKKLLMAVIALLLAGMALISLSPA
ncbi:hypothetical protein [Bryobacter aggregatus]|uniref:hypothetical protein n=1 Tax=Bryobacter aggregatus TaxID=360054 RepID=UPI001EE174F1|nr:hypothetical protein [Bryobacter aggregatus]